MVFGSHRTEMLNEHSSILIIKKAMQYSGISLRCQLRFWSKFIREEGIYLLIYYMHNEEIKRRNTSL